MEHWYSPCRPAGWLGSYAGRPQPAAPRRPPAGSPAPSQTSGTRPVGRTGILQPECPLVNTVEKHLVATI